MNEERSVTVTGFETKLTQGSSELVMPGPWRLLESIKGLMKLANQRLVTANEARWLDHIDVFLNCSIEERIVDVDLLNVPLVSECQGQ